MRRSPVLSLPLQLVFPGLLLADTFTYFRPDWTIKVFNLGIVKLTLKKKTSSCGEQHLSLFLYWDTSRVKCEKMLLSYLKLCSASTDFEQQFHLKRKLLAPIVGDFGWGVRVTCAVAGVEIKWEGVCAFVLVCVCVCVWEREREDFWQSQC